MMYVRVTNFIWRWNKCWQDNISEFDPGIQGPFDSQSHFLHCCRYQNFLWWSDCDTSFVWKRENRRVHYQSKRRPQTTNWKAIVWKWHWKAWKNRRFLWLHCRSSTQTSKRQIKGIKTLLNISNISMTLTMCGLQLNLEGDY